MNTAGKSIFIQSGETFFEGIDKGSQVWMSHSDTIDQLPDRGILLASTEDVKNAAYCIEGETSFEFSSPRGLSYHRWKKAFGELFDQNCGVQQDWTLDSLWK